MLEIGGESEAHLFDRNLCPHVEFLNFSEKVGDIPSLAMRLDVSGSFLLSLVIVVVLTEAFGTDYDQL